MGEWGIVKGVGIRDYCEEFVRELVGKWDR